MTYLIFLMAFCLLFGAVGVASNPAPFYGAMGLVLGAFGGFSMLVGLGGSFIGLVLFMIYLGGMLVVFAYSVALAAEPYPETWGGTPVFFGVVGYIFLILFMGEGFVELMVSGGHGVVGVDSSGLVNYRADFGGVVLLFSVGGVLLLLCGWALLLALFVVLELTRGRSRGALRVP